MRSYILAKVSRLQSETIFHEATDVEESDTKFWGHPHERDLKSKFSTRPFMSYIRRIIQFSS